jgi:hypothetical protein
MPLYRPRDVAIAVVGDGFGSLIVYATAVYMGFSPEQVTVFGPSDTPIGTYQQFAFNLGQTVLRSESESHFLPADWPTFAQLDAWARRDVSYLVRSVRRRYNPAVSDILAEAMVVADELGWHDSRFPAKVGWLQRDGATFSAPYFVLYDEDARIIGRARHVVLAVGHGPLSFPPALQLAKNDARLGTRIVQAYEAKEYDPRGRYVVIGAGIASVNEWANILDAGAECISLTRNPEPDEQDLNTPRCFFEALGLDAYQALDFHERVAFLGEILKGTTPRRRGWIDTIEQGRHEGRFGALVGEIVRVEPGPLGLRIYVSSRHGPDPGAFDVTGVVAGTGFNKSALSVPLLRRVIEFYGVPIEDGRMRLQSNCGVPGLDRHDSRCAVMGIHANSVVAHADTIAGLKYIGRRFVADCYRAERAAGAVRRRRLGERLAMQLTLARRSVAAIRQTRVAAQIS